VRGLNSTFLPKLEQIIDKALEKDRALPYLTAAAVRADLQGLKRDTNGASNIVDAIPRRVPPGLPWWRSNLALGMGVLLLVCVILVAVFHWWHKPSLAGPSELRPLASDCCHVFFPTERAIHGSFGWLVWIEVRVAL
jgi:hypothetical protein